MPSELKYRSSLPIAIALAGAVMALGLLLGGLALLRPRPVANSTVEALRPTPDVITAVQDLARLETTRFHIERVIDLRDRHQWLFGMLEGEDSILLIAAGDVVGGVDLGRLRASDVSVDHERRSARLVLPPPEVLSATLDSERTYVFSRETDLFARRSEALETRARRAAEESIRSAALEAGILERASSGAVHTVSSLLRGLGFEDVEIRFATDER